MGARFASNRFARFGAFGPSDPSAGVTHVSEIAEILAAGLMRLLVQKSSRISVQDAENSLDISVAESGHPTPMEGRTKDV